MNSAFGPLWGLQRQCFSFRNLSSNLDYSRALILLAHLILGLSLPFSAIPPAAAGVVHVFASPRGRSRNVGLFSFCNFNLNVYAARRLGSNAKNYSLNTCITWKLGEKSRQKSWPETVAHPGSNPGPSLGRPEARPSC